MPGRELGVVREVLAEPLREVVGGPTGREPLCEEVLGHLVELDHAFTRDGAVVPLGGPADHGVYLLVGRVQRTHVLPHHGGQLEARVGVEIPSVDRCRLVDDTVVGGLRGAVDEVVPLRVGRGVGGGIHSVPHVFRGEIFGRALVASVDVLRGDGVGEYRDLPHQGLTVIGVLSAGQQVLKPPPSLESVVDRRHHRRPHAVLLQVLCPFAAEDLDESWLPGRRQGLVDLVEDGRADTTVDPPPDRSGRVVVGQGALAQGAAQQSAGVQAGVGHARQSFRQNRQVVVVSDRGRRPARGRVPTPASPESVSR